MSSCVNRNLFGRNSSPQSPPKFIPYKRLEQTAPSWIVGQLKSWKSAKSVKLMKNLNTFMSSCAISNLFRRNSSAHSMLKFIPYPCLEQTAPSLIAGPLNI